jgi:hypothetical protein
VAVTTYVDETGYVWEKRPSPPPLDWEPGRVIEVRGARFLIVGIHRELSPYPREPQNKVVIRGVD